MRIWMGNLGYMRGINGSLAQHLRYAHRHIYCPANTQKRVIHEVKTMLEQESPDICCFVEIDGGSVDNGDFEQLSYLAGTHYPFSDIENKYGEESHLRRLPFTRGKSNGFMARRFYPFERWYMRRGTKRLGYTLKLDEKLHLMFTHFSLKKHVRAQQLHEIRTRIESTPGEIILLGDFNILTGTGELGPLLSSGNLKLVNREDEHTFRFHRVRKMLDLCIVSESLLPRISLRILPQPYSDHDALLVDVKERAHG